MTDTLAPLAPFPAAETSAIRHDWTVAEIQAIHDLPLLDLVFRAAQVHRPHLRAAVWTGASQARLISSSSRHTVSEAPAMSSAVV